MHTTSASLSHVVIHDLELHNASIELNQPQGFVHHGSHIHIPPYPPSQYGLTFDQTQFLQCMQAAEADVGKYSFSESENSEGLDILHMRWHQLHEKQVPLAVFMAGREPAEGTPGSIIFRHLINSIHQPEHSGTEEIHCLLFFANVAIGGNGTEVLPAYMIGQPVTQPDLLTRDQAISFVDALLKVEVATISRDSIR
jgi:hypothetical protein